MSLDVKNSKSAYWHHPNKCLYEQQQQSTGSWPLVMLPDMLSQQVNCANEAADVVHSCSGKEAQTHLTQCSLAKGHVRAVTRGSAADNMVSGYSHDELIGCKASPSFALGHSRSDRQSTPDGALKGDIRP